MLSIIKLQSLTGGFYLKKNFNGKPGRLGPDISVLFSSPYHFLSPFKSLKAESDGKWMKNSG